MQITDKNILLQRVNKKWAKTCVCKLKNNATQAVPGVGSANAKILFLGEAPGKKEDACGNPFVGKSGKFLTELLNSIQIRREDVYITNIVKYRPPDNRDPHSTEINDCLPWLLEQINIIKPQAIVFLGRKALNCFFPKEQLSKIHGQLITRKIKDCSTENFFALYHPAASFYNGKIQKIIFSDFKKLSKIIKAIV